MKKICLLFLLFLISQLTPSVIQAAANQPLRINVGSVVMFSGRRYVVICTGGQANCPAGLGETYLWSATAQMHLPWHNLNTGYNNNSSDFNTNPDKLGYWLNQDWYNNLHSVQKNWLVTTTYNYGGYDDISYANLPLSAKVTLPSRQEWFDSSGLYAPLSAWANLYNSAVYTAFNQILNTYPQHFLWLRTPYTVGGNTTLGWVVFDDGTPDRYDTRSARGIIPAFTLKDTIFACQPDGLVSTGSYHQPYYLGDGDCSTLFDVPTLPPKSSPKGLRKGSVIALPDTGLKLVKLSDIYEPYPNNNYYAVTTPMTTSPWTSGSTDNIWATSTISSVLDNLWSGNTLMSDSEKSLVLTQNYLVGNNLQLASFDSEPVSSTSHQALSLMSIDEWSQSGGFFCQALDSRAAGACQYSLLVDHWLRTPYKRNSLYTTSNRAWFSYSFGSSDSDLTGTSNQFYPSLTLIDNLCLGVGNGTLSSPLAVDQCPAVAIDFGFDNQPVDLYWHSLDLSPTQNTFQISGTFLPTPEATTYQITLAVNGVSGTLGDTTITTSTTQNTPFSLEIPIGAFGASGNNYLFLGPQKLIVTNTSTSLSTKVYYYVNFVFPVFQVGHQANPGYYILSSQSTLN